MENTDVKSLSTILKLEEDFVKDLINETIETKKFCYHAYSQFRVSSILVTEDLKKYTGVNVENVSYGCTICAERTAIVKAVSEGEKKFRVITVCTDIDTFVTPCGACRQVIKEFNINNVILINGKNDLKFTTMDYLLPFSCEIPGLYKL